MMEKCQLLFGAGLPARMPLEGSVMARALVYRGMARMSGTLRSLFLVL